MNKDKSQKIVTSVLILIEKLGDNDEEKLTLSLEVSMSMIRALAVLLCNTDECKIDFFNTVFNSLKTSIEKDDMDTERMKVMYDTLMKLHEK